MFLPTPINDPVWLGFMHQTAMLGLSDRVSQRLQCLLGTSGLNCAIKWPECVMVIENNTILMLVLEYLMTKQHPPEIKLDLKAT